MVIVIDLRVCASSTVSFSRGVQRAQLLRRTGFQLQQKRRFFHRSSVSWANSSGHLHVTPTYVTAGSFVSSGALCAVTFSFFFFFHLTYSRWTSSLPSCLWSQRIFPSLPGSRLTIFLSRCKFSTLTTRQPMVEFYLLTFPRFPLRKKEHKSYFGKNRTHDFRTSRCAAYLLDHSGDEQTNWNAFSRLRQALIHIQTTDALGCCPRPSSTHTQPFWPVRIMVAPV